MTADTASIFVYTLKPHVVHTDAQRMIKHALSTMQVAADIRFKLVDIDKTQMHAVSVSIPYDAEAMQSVKSAVFSAAQAHPEVFASMTTLEDLLEQYE